VKEEEKDAEALAVVEDAVVVAAAAAVAAAVVAATKRMSGFQSPSSDASLRKERLEVSKRYFFFLFQ
jgi:hypothetical protein